MALSSLMVPLGTPAPAFTLPSVEGPAVSLTDFDGQPLLVMFLCNHCPYVRHVETTLGKLVAEYTGQGLSAVAITSNDVENYPDDGPAGTADQIARAGFTFPYLLDGDQSVAAAYRAVCTPDLFLYDAGHRLAYRGAFDESRPRSETPVTGDLLRAAIEHVLRGEPVPEPHVPSMGCGIKWTPGNEPAWMSGL